MVCFVCIIALHTPTIRALSFLFSAASELSELSAVTYCMIRADYMHDGLIQVPQSGRLSVQKVNNTPTVCIPG